ERENQGNSMLAPFAGVGPRPFLGFPETRPRRLLRLAYCPALALESETTERRGPHVRTLHSLSAAAGPFRNGPWGPNQAPDCHGHLCRAASTAGAPLSSPAESSTALRRSHLGAVPADDERPSAGTSRVGRVLGHDPFLGLFPRRQVFGQRERQPVPGP